MTKRTRIVAVSFIGTVLILIVALAFFYFRDDIGRGADPRTAGLTKVSGYNSQVYCAAMMPGCGLCYGEVIDGDCYVDKAKLTTEQLNYMGL